MITFFQAIILGLLQGVTELFPVSSLGHSVIVPALFHWDNIVGNESARESSYLAVLVGFHCATAIALIWFYRNTWVSIVKSFFKTLKTRQVTTSSERLAWLLITATIPAGLIGLLFEHKFRVVFAKPIYAAVFLTINGCILLAGELYRRRAEHIPAKRSLDKLEYKEAGVVGVAQTLALLAGISRSGTTMVAGLVRGLSHEDAANFSFLLATPIILAAGVYKLPDLMGPNGDGIRGQVLVGSIVSGLAAYFSVKFLTRYFQTRTLMPFAIYCLVFGLLMIVHFA
jgi:undecaprenyl-diphosphatase